MLRRSPIALLFIIVLVLSCRKNVETKSELLQESTGGKKDAAGKYIDFPQSPTERAVRLQEVEDRLKIKYGGDADKWKIIQEFITDERSKNRNIKQNLEVVGVLGGPGTGKTTVLQDLLDACVELKIKKRVLFQTHQRGKLVDLYDYVKRFQMEDKTGKVGNPLFHAYKNWQEALAKFERGEISLNSVKKFEKKYFSVLFENDSVVVIDEGTNAVGAIAPSYASAMEQYTPSAKNPIPEADPKHPQNYMWTYKRDNAIREFVNKANEAKLSIERVWAAFTDGGVIKIAEDVNMRELIDDYYFALEAYNSEISKGDGVRLKSALPLMEELSKLQNQVDNFEAIDDDAASNEHLALLKKNIATLESRIKALNISPDELDEFSQLTKSHKQDMRYTLSVVVTYDREFADDFKKVIEGWTEENFPDKQFLEYIKMNNEFEGGLEGWKKILLSSRDIDIVETVRQIQPSSTRDILDKAFEKAKLVNPGQEFYANNVKIYITANTEFDEFARDFAIKAEKEGKTNDEIVEALAREWKKHFDPEEPIDLTKADNYFTKLVRQMFGIVELADGSQSVKNLDALVSRLRLNSWIYVNPPKTAAWRAYVLYNLTSRALGIRRQFYTSDVKINIFYDESVVNYFAAQGTPAESFRTFKKRFDALAEIENIVNSAQAKAAKNIAIIFEDGEFKALSFPQNQEVPIDQFIIKETLSDASNVLASVKAPVNVLSTSKYIPEEDLVRIARSKREAWAFIMGSIFNGSTPEQLELATKDSEDAFSGVFTKWPFFNSDSASGGARKTYLELIEANKAIIHLTRYTYDMTYGGNLPDLPNRARDREAAIEVLGELVNIARRTLKLNEDASIAEVIQNGFSEDYKGHAVIAALIKNKGDVDKTLVELQEYIKKIIYDSSDFKALADKYGNLLQRHVQLEDQLLVKQQELRIALSKFSEESDEVKKLISEKRAIEGQIENTLKDLRGGYFADDLVKTGQSSRTFPNKNIFKFLKERQRGIFYIENLQILRDFYEVKDDFLHRLYRKIHNICARGR